MEPPSVDDHDAYRAWCETNGDTYVPGFVQRQPPWTEVFTFCPGCMFQFRPPNVPQKSGNCPACGDRYWIRTCPDGVRRVLNETATIEVECLDAESSPYLDMIGITAGSPSTAGKSAMRDKLRYIARGRVLAQWGRGPWINERGEPDHGAPIPPRR